MSKLLCLCLIGSIILFGLSKYNGSTTASVVLAGGIIKAKSVVVDKKFKRKDCPVCKGQGWYLSGDKISKVDCGYCEPDKKSDAPTEFPKKVITHSPITIQQNCQSGTCVIRK